MGFPTCRNEFDHHVICVYLYVVSLVRGLFTSFDLRARPLECGVSLRD